MSQENNESPIRGLIDLVEAKSTHQLEQVKLPYNRNALSPIMSSATIDTHYGKLYKGYVDRYNAGTGDKAFNEAGAYLHEIFFLQFKSPVPNASVRPRGKILDLINRCSGSFVDFKKEIKETAMKIQGSGWIYLSRTGTIRTINNHQKRSDIALLIDWWEHAWAIDYHSDKEKYLDSIWRIIDWDAVNRRL